MSEAVSDSRRPAEISDAFRARLAELLLPLGFELRAKGARFVRKHGRATHHVELSSSHRNSPEHVTCWVTLRHEDKLVRKLAPGWAAGGGLGLAAFSSSGSIPENVADAREADALIALVRERLAFFDLMDDPAEVRSRVSVGYVPGLVDPVVIVPYLRAHSGTDAVSTYAKSLLAGRPELWPAVAGHVASQAAEPPNAFADHGTQLAGALTADELAALEVPEDVVRSTERSAKALRSHFGLQLRAWGEVEAAALLRRCDDGAIVEARERVEALADSSVTSVEAARIVLELACGEQRAPRRSSPEPRFFQYHAGHSRF